MWNLKCGRNKPVYKTDFQTENRPVAAGGGGGGGTDLKFRVGRCKLLPVEWINNEVTLYREQFPTSWNCDVKECRKKCVYIYIYIYIYMYVCMYV